MTIGPVSGASPTGSASPANSLRGAARSPLMQDAQALAAAFAKAGAHKGGPMAGNAALLGQNADLNFSRALLDRGDDKDALASLLTPGSHAGAQVQAAAPPPPSSMVDPSVFADMLTKLWLREQGRTTREVRVSFGDSAWPATGASLTRLEDGSLRVTVSLGDRGASGSAAIDSLKERLQARGLPVAEIAFENV